MSEGKSGVRKSLGERKGRILSDNALNWITDKILPIVVTLLVALMVWVVSQLFALNGVIMEKANENTEKIRELELRTAERIVCLEQDVKYIRESVGRIETKINREGR